MSIIIIDQKQILDPRIASVVSNYSHNWNSVHALSRLNANNSNYAVRAGKNTLAFDNSIVKKLDLAMPAPDKKFSCTLQEITDQRCHWLKQMYNDKPWLIFWSGGVDSTAILTSILKNLSAADLTQITIACNKISVYENPRFYYDYVVPNFKTIDSTFLLLDIKLLTDYYVINGEFSDQLFSGAVSMQLQQKDPASLQREWLNDPDQLLNYVESKMKSRKFAEQFYQVMSDNIKSVDVEITTYHDFFWWFFFNMMWPNVKLRPIMKQHYTPDLMKLYLKNCISWFEAEEYQLWAMNNNRYGTKYGSHVGQYKLELKKYIHDYNHDDYYLAFKTKGNSTGMIKTALNWFCLLDDFTALNLDDNLEQILELLPAHIV